MINEFESCPESDSKKVTHRSNLKKTTVLSNDSPDPFLKKATNKQTANSSAKYGNMFLRKKAASSDCKIT